MEEERVALQLRQEWQNAAPNDPLAKRAVATSLQEIAGDLDRFGKFEEALAQRERVLSILEELNASTPAGGLGMSLALAHKRLARSLVRVGRIEEGIAHATRAVQLERAEVARNPVAIGTRSALSFSLIDLGAAMIRKGEARSALVPLGEALRIRTEIAEADPRDWRAGSLLAVARLQHGRALVATGRSEEGIAQLRRALADRQDLADRNARNAGARGEVAEAAAALADALGRSPQARPLYQRALTIYRELLSAGSLTAELATEPTRIEALLRR
jgi:tetratricopeptide (TPR) repeat protein